VYFAGMTRTSIAATDENGARVELFSRDDAFDVEIGGRLVVATDVQHANAAFAELSLGLWAGRDDISVILGGLGSGLLLKEVLARPGVIRVDVVEASASIIAWEREHFAALNGGATADPRVRVHHGELGAFIQGTHADGPKDAWSAILVDTDEPPEKMSRAGNAVFYTDDGLPLLAEPLRGGGVIALWSTAKDDDLLRRLHRRFQNVARIGAAGDQGLVYIYRGRRGPRAAS
jgi:spermidine synthase